MDQEQQSKKMGQIIAKCWADDSFKQQLLADPISTLKMEGMELPKGLDVKVLIDTDALYHLVIPVTPSDLSDDDLQGVAGGDATCYQCDCCCCIASYHG